MLYNRNLGVTHIGELGRESEVSIKGMDRHSAERKAQTDIGMVHDSAEITTRNDLSADGRAGHAVRTLSAELQDIARSSRSLWDTSGGHDETNVRMAVGITRDHRTAASPVGGQNTSLHLIGVERSESNNADGSFGPSGAKEVDPRQDCRRSSLRDGEKVSYVYEDPDEAFDEKHAKDEAWPTNNAFAAPHVNGEHASATHKPSDMHSRPLIMHLKFPTMHCTSRRLQTVRS